MEGDSWICNSRITTCGRYTPVDGPVGFAHTRWPPNRHRTHQPVDGPLGFAHTGLRLSPQGNQVDRAPSPDALTPRAGGPRGESQAQQGHLEGIPTSSALAEGPTKANLPTTTLGRGTGVSQRWRRKHWPRTTATDTPRLTPEVRRSRTCVALRKTHSDW